jgi:hypothetical protein
MKPHRECGSEIVKLTMSIIEAFIEMLWMAASAYRIKVETHRKTTVTRIPIIR